MEKFRTIEKIVKILEEGSVCPENVEKISKQMLTKGCQVLAETSPELKSFAVIEFSPLFWDILIQPLSFLTRLEVLKTNNLLLEQCPIKIKEELLNKEVNGDKILGMVKTVQDIGDYEFQVGVIEFLMRLFPKKHRQKYASIFIQDKDMLNEFLSIKDKDFEIDCRLFLNSINIKAEDPTQGVFSLPCVSAFIGNKELRKPSDDGYEEFWVDFNIGSKRITLFCEQSSLCSQKRSKSSEVIQPLRISLSDVAKANSQQVPAINQSSGSKSSSDANMEPTMVKNCRVSVPAIPMTPDSICGRNSDKDLSQEYNPETVLSNGNTKNKDRLAKIEQNLDRKKEQKKMKTQSEVQDFKAPATPKKKTKSRQKVKTPVVTVTPPPKKEKNKRSSNSKTEESSLVHNFMDHKCEESYDVIPDSLPLENVSGDLKKSRNTSKLKKNDSGIESDVSLSKTLNESEIILDQDKDNSPTKVKNAEKTFKDSKKKSRTNKAKSSIDAPHLQFNTIENNDKKHAEVIAQHEPDNQVETFTAKKLSDVDKVDKYCFGFDSLICDESIECIPDSSENQTNTVNTCADVHQNTEIFQPNHSTKKENFKHDKKMVDEKKKSLTSDDVKNALKEKNPIEISSDKKKRNKKGKKSKNQNTTNDKLPEFDEEKTKNDRKKSKCSSDVSKKEENRKNGNKSSKNIEESFHSEKDSYTRSLRSRRKKVNYIDADTSLCEDEDELNEETDELNSLDATTNNVTDDYQTPNGTPEKDVIDEKKVKSSLKKNKNNSYTNCHNPDRRKAKVSFDLPSSQSQGGEVKVSKVDNKSVPDESETSGKNDGLINDGALVINDSDISEDLSGVIPDSIDIEDSKIGVHLKEIISAEKETCKLNVGNKKAKDKGNNGGINDEFRELEEAFAVDGELDSLYIESDDSYNERRYRMEVKEKDRYQKRRSRRSSMKKDIKEKKTKEKDEYNSDQEIKTLNGCIIKIHQSDDSSDNGRDETNISYDNENLRAKRSAKSCKTKKSEKSSYNKSISTTKPNKSNDRNSEVSWSDQESSKSTERKGRGKRSTSKENKKLSFSYRESLAEIDKMDDSFSMSQHRVEGSMNSGKRIVFERSYLKSNTNINPTVSLCRLENFSKFDQKTEPAYDPYDFTAQCDNSSMASERINRKGMSKEMNKKQATKVSTKKVSHHSEEDFSRIWNGDNRNDKPKTSLVQDKKTNKWHRVTEQTHKNEEREKKSKESTWKENDDSVINVDDDDNGFYDDESSCCIVNNNVKENVVNQDISSFDKVIQEITSNRMRTKKLLDSLSNGEDNIILNDGCEPRMSPFVVKSLSSTPKVGSSGRKHYKPLNISIIKTPQSCHGVDSDSQSDSCSKAQKKTRKKRHSSSKSKKTSPESEKSWILERKKPPKHKDNDKTYTYRSQKYKLGKNNSQSEISSEDNCSPTIDKILQSPITISSVCCTTPALSAGTKSVGCLDEIDCSIYSPVSPVKTSKQSELPGSNDIEVEHRQENYSMSLANMDNDTNKLLGYLNDDSFNEYPLKTPQKETLNDESDDDEETSIMKILPHNLKMHGDSGFMSEEDVDNFVSSNNSPSESNHEEEYSTFIPKKLFKFDPEAVAAPKTVSVSSSWNDEPVDYIAKLPILKSAFGVDIHKQFQERKRGIELMAKNCFKETRKYLTQTLVEQQQYQTNLTDNLQAKMFHELKAIEKDIQMLHEAEQKTEDFFKYQISVLQNSKESQRHGLQKMKAAEASHFEKKRTLSKNNLMAHVNIFFHYVCLDAAFMYFHYRKKNICPTYERIATTRVFKHEEKITELVLKLMIFKECIVLIKKMKVKFF
ncbi:male genitalia morphogenesis [Mactra antiquata]